MTAARPSWRLPEGFDRRTTPARPDLAAASLRGRVEARRYVEGEPHVVRVGVLDLKRQPRPDAPLDTQLLYGERVTVFDEEEGWAWVQGARDGYVGYAAVAGLAAVASLPDPAQPSHRVGVTRAHIYPAPDMKQPALNALPLDALVVAGATRGAFTKVDGFGWMVSRHLRRLDAEAADMAGVAEALVGTPYLWGGRTGLGIDCSGLVQLAASLAGIPLPRDTDMQRRMGRPVGSDVGAAPLCRGDLVFWDGHVGIMADPHTLVHANAFHMLVAREALDEATRRIEEGGSQIVAMRRLDANI